MDEYTYDDVLTEKDVRTGKVDIGSIIGKLGWFSDDMSGCLCEVDEEEPRRLLAIRSESSYPFVDELNEPYQCFMLSKQQPEEDYGNDKKWRFGRGADGRIGVVIDHHGNEYYIRLNDLTFEIVFERDFKEIKGHFAPFDISDYKARDLLRDKWIGYERTDHKGRNLNHSARICRFTLVMDHLMRLQNSYVLVGDEQFTLPELLKKCSFTDGTPCGVVVEDKEE